MKRERIEVWRPADVAGVELRRGVSVAEPYPRHWHEEYQLCLVQAGGGELFYRGAHHPTPAASLFVVHPGEVHANQTATGCSFRSLYLAPQLLRDACEEIAARAQPLPFFPDPLIFDRDLVAAYLALHHSLEAHAPSAPEDRATSSMDARATTMERESLLAALLARLVTRYARVRGPRAASRGGGERAAVARVRDYVASNYARNVTLTELARVAHLSPFHLTRVFTKEVGMPPHAFQTQVRVAHAKRLIRRGLPLSIVAAAAGFADQSHLIRHFKRLLKITPGEYSKNSKNVQYAPAAAD